MESEYNREDKQMYARKLAEIDYNLMTIEKWEVKRAMDKYLESTYTQLRDLLTKRLIDFAQAELYRDYSEPLNKAS